MLQHLFDVYYFPAHWGGSTVIVPAEGKLVVVSFWQKTNTYCIKKVPPVGV